MSDANRIGKLLRPETDANESLCFFGTGALFHACFEQLVLVAGKRPDFLCDNNAEKWGRSFFGIPCVAPDDLPADHEHTKVILCLQDFEAASIQLRALGYNRVYLAHFNRGYHQVDSLRRIEADSIASQATPDYVLRSLRGQWALVTGASRGIGQQIARALATHGLNLICHARTDESAHKACHSLAVDGITALPFAADLANQQALDNLCVWLAKSAPPISVLYNNAGISPPCPEGFWGMTTKELSLSYAVNAIAPIRICQAVIPGMKARGFGRVVNVSSSIQCRPDEMAYACSKAALDKFVHDLSPHLESTGVMMSLLDPGWLRTDMGGVAAPQDVGSVLPGALLGALVNGNVNGRWISAQDYNGQTLENAARKAFFVGACS
jgi:NAD(P)-dependent dehydrogenase (short-subunit alcohol dehydrogenase family)